MGMKTIILTAPEGATVVAEKHFKDDEERMQWLGDYVIKNYEDNTSTNCSDTPPLVIWVQSSPLIKSYALSSLETRLEYWEVEMYKGRSFR